MPIDPNSLPRDAETLRKIVVDLAEQLDRSLVEQNKYQTLLRDPVFSPDSRWIAYSMSRLAGPAFSDQGVFVQPFPSTGAVYQAPKLQIDFHPVWASDGKELTFVPSSASGELATVKVTTQRGLTFGAPVTSPARVTGSRLVGEPRAYDILPDGRFIGLIDASEPRENAAFEIRVVLNWFEELKERVKSAR